MNEKASITLEYNKIIGLLEEKTASAMGKEYSNNLKPIDDIEEICKRQSETSEAVGLILKKGSLPIGGIRDIRSSIKRALVSGMLSIEELMHVGDFIYVCKKIINYSINNNSRKIPLQESSPILADLFETIQPTPKLESEILRCIVNENEISDDASPKLREIRRNINVSNGRIREQLNSIIHSQNYKNYLQDTVITTRNGRFCVPIKAEHRNNFQGMIHDQSSTGATLFVEPMAVVSLNNKIRELMTEEKNEIEVILTKLSMLVGEHSDILSTNIKSLAELDFIFAKAELSISMNATEPIFNNKRYINIKKGRHPLLDSNNVIPTDIYLGGDFTTLLITGPNTGGKTVSLKTLGLFTLMGQAGLHIPASDKSELSVFDEVFADIGDEQSIEQSLSTFSGHMTNIVKILENVTDYSLVLLDELGAGTDPTEGAALGIAIIQYLHNRKIRCAVTTHYSELKIFALSTEGVENAACEFDVETLKPTYKLLIGIPGKSNAFAISRRLGLPEYIIDSAKSTLSNESERFEDIITDLEISKKTVIMEKERAEQYRRDAEKLKRDYERQKTKLESQREKLMTEARNESRKLIENAKAEADEIIKEMQKIAADGINFKELEEKRRNLREKISDIDKSISSSKNSKKIKPLTKQLKAGDKVFIHMLNQSGYVVSPPDSSGEVMVQAGIMKIKVKIDTISLDESEELITVEGKSYNKSVKAGKSQFISKEIDLRGCTVDEALEKLDKYLDDAYLASLQRVEIIHGKGTGALRAAVQDYVKRHPHIGSFRLGEFGEGDTGVTVVEIK